MKTDIQSELSLGAIDQLGLVVTDLEQAIALYTPLFGEFRIMEATDMDWLYRGKRETSSLRLAFSQSGAIEIELIEWVAGETPHKEFIDQGREGLHHIRFRVNKLEGKVAAARKLGYRAIWTKRFDENLAASYLERDSDPLIIEFFENRSETA